MTRPDLLVAVLGTATDVGKTWVGARLVTELRSRGLAVAARKPVQSFEPDSTAPRDAAVLADASGEAEDVVCPPHRCYALAMAPPMAAAALGITGPALADLVDELRWRGAVDVGVVEAVGGVRSPLADDADSRDLVRTLQPDVVVVVADAGLGTIDATRGAVEALAPDRPIVHLNRFDADDDLHLRNVAWLRDRDGVDVTVAVHDLADRVLAR